MTDTKRTFFRTNILGNVVRLVWFFRLGGVNPWALWWPVFFSVLQTILALLSIRLLFPLTRGIINNDFRGVMDIEGMGVVSRAVPQVFSSSVGTFIFLVLMFYAVTLAKNFFQYLSSRSLLIPVMSATARVRWILMERMLAFGKGFYDQNTVTYLQSILTKSTTLLESQFRLFHVFLTSILLLGVFLFIMGKVSWQLTVISLLVLPLVAAFTRLVVKRLQHASVEHHQASINFSDRVFNMLYCMPVIKTFTREKEELRTFEVTSEKELGHALKVQYLRGLAEPVEDIAATTAILLIAFGMAVLMRVNHAIDASHSIVFFYLIMQLKSRISAFDKFQLGAANAVAAIQDIEKILYHDKAWVVPCGEKTFSGLTTGIELRGLSFSYGEKGPRALDQVSLSIEPRSVVAIAGPSGSGKSTIISLLLRFYDCQPGMIYINGQDIREFDIASLRKSIAFVGQDVLLFNDTIRNNITYGLQGGSTLPDVSDLVEKVQLTDFIKKMPRQYDTVIGDRGGRLSGGERQRLSIARALIKDPPILILDEATSALDSQTEARIMEQVLTASKEKTVIIIAHRFSTIKHADKIIYLEKGRVVEAGSLEELLEKKGSFFKQWQAQKL